MEEERPPQAGALQFPDPGQHGGGSRQVFAGPGERGFAARQQAAARKQAKAAHRVRPLDNLRSLGAHALDGDMRQLVPLAQRPRHVFLAMAKSSTDANRTQRSMRRASSSKRSSALPTQRTRRASKS